jgi:hypothetical protein
MRCVNSKFQFQKTMKVSTLPFFIHVNIFIPQVEKVTVVRRSVFSNSSFQILDGTIFDFDVRFSTFDFRFELLLNQYLGQRHEITTLDFPNCTIFYLRKVSLMKKLRMSCA